MTALRDKEIWELTQSEFVRLSSQKSIPKSRRSLRHKIQKYIEHAKKQLILGLQDEILLNKLVPHDLFDRVNLERIAAKAHKDQIQKALQDGWPVPWNVLRDYPGLSCTSQEKANTQSKDIYQKYPQ